MTDTPHTKKIDASVYEGHTPGPWALCVHSKKRFGVYQRTKGTRSLFILKCADNDVKESENQENAFLMASAPDLLARVRELEDLASKLPRYADVPENGDMAGEPFVPWRDECWVVGGPEKITVMLGPVFYKEAWTVWRGTPQELIHQRFFVSESAAQQYAERGDK